ncbi:MAG: hypothetical protein RL322_1059 [Pseudomonadota bacterium]
MDLTSILYQLSALLGADRVQADALALDSARHDIFFEGAAAPLAIVRPKGAEEVQSLVRLAREHGLSLAPRGAGLSYSAGYVPANAHTVMVDLRSLDRIVAIHADDRYVIVEPGVTWEQLDEALKPLGLRTPFWGTFSGKHATVGGALSQGAKFFGSGNRGSAAESVLALEVVVGDGSLVRTGSWGTTSEATPFYRYYGPDLTGCFLGDCGAHGIKTRIALQLIPRAPILRTASFAFSDAGSMFKTMTSIGADLLASECFAMDPFLVDLRMRFEGLQEDLESFRKVFSAQRSLLAGLRDAATLAFHGRRFAGDVGFLMSVVTEGFTDGEAQWRMDQARSIAARHGARDLPDSLPKVVRASPFRRLNRMLGPEGERIVWFHAQVPNSLAEQLYAATEAVFEAHRADVDRHSLRWGYLIGVNGPSTFGLEPIVYWRDAALPIHREYIAPEHFEKLPAHAANPAAREAVSRIRQAIVTRWAEMGATHLQIGRQYPFLSTRIPGTAQALRALKHAFDPDRIFNPGALET